MTTRVFLTNILLNAMLACCYDKSVCLSVTRVRGAKNGVDLHLSLIACLKAKLFLSSCRRSKFGLMGHPNSLECRAKQIQCVNCGLRSEAALKRISPRDLP